MKISCQSCQAKYTIADEKVLGKVVKIRCKKCSSTIVINGADAQPGAPDERESMAGNDMLDYATSSGDQWTVNVAENDQRTMSTVEIVTEFRAGVLHTETYCWKDGMEGWLPLRQIDQLYKAVSGPGIAALTGGAGDVAPLPPSVPASFSSDVSTERDRAPAAPLFGAGGSGGGNLFGDPAPAAARRDRGRNPSADLFGSAAQAGGENEPAVAAPMAKDESKLMGQRNESSVLFSLASLTSKEEPAKSSNGGKSSEGKTTAHGDGSGLIDIRALSSSSKGDRPKSSGVDDIMNLGGGGAFGAALAAPILAPPAMDTAMASDTSTGGGQSKSNSGLIFAIIGGAGILAVAIVAAIVLTRPPAAPVADGTQTTGPAKMGATGPSALAINDPPKEPAIKEPPPHTTAKEPTPGVAIPGTKPPPGGAAATKPSPGIKPEGPVAPPPTPPPATGGPGKQVDINKAMAGAVDPKPGPAAPPPASGAAFDRGAAAGALGSVNVASCKKADGPTGSGHVTVTFDPNGTVQSAVVDQPPFSGTPVGGCIAGKFRSARVPPFSGSPVKVGKSFTIN